MQHRYGTACELRDLLGADWPIHILHHHVSGGKPVDWRRPITSGKKNLLKGFNEKSLNEEGAVMAI